MSKQVTFCDQHFRFNFLVSGTCLVGPNYYFTLIADHSCTIPLGIYYQNDGGVINPECHDFRFLENEGIEIKILRWDILVKIGTNLVNGWPSNVSLDIKQRSNMRQKSTSIRKRPSGAKPGKKTGRANHRMILSTPRFTVFQDSIYDRNNNKKDHYYLVKPDSVVIVAFKKKKILFLKVKRYLTRTIRYEIPGGRLENGESPINAAKRELLEETGLTSSRWKYLGSTFPLPSVTTEKAYMFSAAISEEDGVSLDANARDEGIVGYRFLDFENVWQTISNNQVSCPIDGFAPLLFLQRQYNKFRQL